MLVSVVVAIALLGQASSSAPSDLTSSSQQAVAQPAPSPHEISELKQKAEAGDAASQFALARAYENGKGVPQNGTLAFQWCRKAAEQGNADAQNELGIMYRNGIGVERNKEEAVNWYKKAARQGNSHAMFNLGAAYYNGDGVEINDITAYAWFLLAKQAGSSAAADAVQRQEAEMKSGGVRDGYLRIAEMYEKGQELLQNYAEAIFWYRKAGELGSDPAQVRLLELLEEGRGGEQDVAQTRQWCQREQKKNIRAAYCLGRMYQLGWGVPQDFKSAIELYRKAAGHGEGKAMLQLGHLYWDGTGVKPNKSTAYMWTLLSYSERVPAAKDLLLAQKQQMSGEELDKAQQKAEEFLRAHPVVHLLRPPS